MSQAAADIGSEKPAVEFKGAVKFNKLNVSRARESSAPQFFFIIHLTTYNFKIL
jgi:hypothetical protein